MDHTDTTETRFIADDIVCDGCAAAIKRTLGRVPGVADVQVDVPSKTVTVHHAATADRETLAAALDRAGFPIRDEG